MLTAVGLGPGDAELLTLKAVRRLSEADTVFVPGGIASELVKLYAREIVVLEFPMTRDEEVITACMERNAEKIVPVAKAGKAVFGLIGVRTTTQPSPGLPKWCGNGIRALRWRRFRASVPLPRLLPMHGFR